MLLFYYLSDLNTDTNFNVPLSYICINIITDEAFLLISCFSFQTNASMSSILLSPVKIDISKDGREEIDSPSSGNAEFTTASSGARQTTETSEETEHPIGLTVSCSLQSFLELNHWIYLRVNQTVCWCFLQRIMMWVMMTRRTLNVNVSKSPLMKRF